MCESITVSLPRTKCENIRVLFSRIRLLFGVSVEISPDAVVLDQPPPGQGSNASILKNPENTKFILTLVEGGFEKLCKAKEYLLSACSEESRCERRYAPDAFRRLLPMRDELERDSGALVRFEGAGLVLVSGQEKNVMTALRMLDTGASREAFRQGRHLESEDSSYDSDHEDQGAEEPHPHDDVSRTVSDTLAAEFAEYVTVPHYTSRVEFALKLGYTESQVQTALQTLGAQPSQNELLAELIKLGAAPAPPPADEVAVQEPQEDEELRHIVVDGSNVAMSHGNKECFSCRGIKICVDWFRARGHRNITVFVPRWRKEVSRPDAPIKDQDILVQLEKERLLVFTPSRHVGGRRLVCYDDRYILKLAVDSDGIVVSNDNYRDLVNESPEFKKIVEERLLMYSFVNDRFMPPDDPLGRHGPSLDNFLRKPNATLRTSESLPPPCPYAKKCTYGNKCKYHHPERGNQPQKSVTERLAEQAKIPLQEVKSRGLKSRESSPGDKLKSPTAISSSSSAKSKKQPLARTKSLVPSSALSENTLDKPNTVERTKSDGGSCVKSEETLRREKPLFQPMTTSCYSPASTFSSGPTWSPAMPQISLTSESAQMGSSATGSWASISTTLPPNIPGSCAEMFLEPESGGHLFVAKRLSDPDNHSGNKPSSMKSFPKQSSQAHQVPEATNLHRKLQRQLTLNPAYDPRLVQLGGYVERPHQMLTPQQEAYILQTQEQSNLMPKANSQENIHMLQRGFGAPLGHIPHQPLNRMGSESRVASTLQVASHVWEGAPSEHQTVTRNASAPDSYNQWPLSSRMQHLNSTSDTRLNMFPDMQSLPAHCLPLAGNYAELQAQRHWLSQSHGLDPPRPMSPAGMQTVGSSWAEQPLSGMARGSSQVIGQPVRPSSVPPPGIQQNLMPPQGRAASPDLSDNARYRLYFHLASIFPKEQVQAVMDLYPQETNPQKICAAILSMFPKG